MEGRLLNKQIFQNELKVWNTDLAVLKARIQTDKNDMQITLNEKIVDLEHQLIEAQELLTMMADADEALWTSCKEKMEGVWRSTKATYIEAAWLSTKANYQITGT